MTTVQKPPEAVLCGENVPRENQQDADFERAIQRIVSALKQRGPPYTTMSETELRERAVELHEKYGGDA